MQTNHQPSLKAIIGIDYFSLVAFLIPAVIWGMFLLLPLLGEKSPPNMLYYAIGLTVISLLALGWRVSQFYAVFGDGQEASATICNVSFFRDRGHIDYIYTFMGQKYQSSNALHRSKRAQSYQEGDTVVVMVDYNHPKRAFIRDLYL